VKRLAAAAAVLLVLAVGSCSAAVFLIGGAGAANASCLTATAPTITAADLPSTAGAPATASATTGGLPETVGSYHGEQVRNAGEIVLAAQGLGLDARAQAIGVMTAIGESSLINVDHGDTAGPDSRGLFQQRDNGAWGSLADRMNPRTAATNFFKALQKVNGWQTMAPTLAAHAVQRNADPYHYEPYWDDAVQLVSVLTGIPDLAAQLPASGELTCAPGQAGTFTGPGGTFTPEECSVVPDPSTGRGCLTPRMLALETQLKAQGWRLSCWDPHPQNPDSDHPKGRACDAFPGQGGVLPTAAEKARGDTLAAALQASAKQTGLNYLIWYGQIWSVTHADEGWRPYNGGGVYDPASITGGHYDHIHISVY
jgi:hypothetical protein